MILESKTLPLAFKAIGKTMVRAKKAVPVLGNVAASADGNGLTLRTFDGVIHSAVIDGNVDCTTVIDRCLLPNDAVKAAATKKAFAIDIDGQNWRCVGLSGKGFEPAKNDVFKFRDLPAPTAGTMVATFDSEVFKAAIDAVKMAVDDESSRYALGAIELRHQSGKLFLTATDGRRLHNVEVEGDCAEEGLTLLINPAAVEKLFSMLREITKESVELSVYAAKQSEHPSSLRMVIFHVFGGRGTQVLTAFEEIAGRFPRWPDVIQREDNDIIVPLPADIVEILSGIPKDPMNEGVCIENGVLWATPNGMNWEHEADLASPGEERFWWPLKVKFLLDAIRAAGPKACLIGRCEGGPPKQGIHRVFVVSPKNPGFVGVVMPVSIDGAKSRARMNAEPVGA